MIDRRLEVVSNCIRTAPTLPTIVDVDTVGVGEE
jgi:hypothetical protein